MMSASSATPSASAPAAATAPEPSRLGLGHRLRCILAVARLLLLQLYRRRDLYVALFLGLLVVVPLASVNLFGVEGVVRYLSEVSLLLIWIVSIVICISMTARQLPEELERRTILPLLSKPVRRSDVLLGKLLGASLATGSAVLLFYAFFVVLALTKGLALGAPFVQAMLLHLGFCVLLAAITLLGSVLLTAAANVTVVTVLTVGMLLFGERLPHFAGQSSGIGAGVLRVIHWIGPHFEFFDLRLRVIHDWPPASWGAVLLALLYAAVYSGAVMTAACLIFRRKAL